LTISISISAATTTHHLSHHSTLPTASSITNPPISNTSGIIVNNIALALTIIR
jgi:hypothetical protein